MFNDKVLAKISSYYPNVKIKFKNESTFMKILGTLMFWNKEFMTGYTTTIGNTLYFPNKEYIGPHPVTTFATLLHELVHVYDANRLSRLLFSFLYLFPQSLLLLAPLCILLGPASLFILICALPIPAWFRMNFEKRAYLVSLYILNQLNIKYGFNIDLEKKKESYMSHFKDFNYYLMWPFSLTKDFDAGLAKIKNGEHPYSDPVFLMIDDILSDYTNE